jgi:hypothetical protein
MPPRLERRDGPLGSSPQSWEAARSIPGLAAGSGRGFALLPGAPPAPPARGPFLQRASSRPWASRRAPPPCGTFREAPQPARAWSVPPQREARPPSTRLGRRLGPAARPWGGVVSSSAGSIGTPQGLRTRGQGGPAPGPSRPQPPRARRPAAPGNRAPPVRPGRATPGRRRDPGPERRRRYDARRGRRVGRGAQVRDRARDERGG